MVWPPVEEVPPFPVAYFFIIYAGPSVESIKQLCDLCPIVSGARKITPVSPNHAPACNQLEFVQQRGSAYWIFHKFEICIAKFRRHPLGQ